jgi:hypothetical protein
MSDPGINRVQEDDTAIHNCIDSCLVFRPHLVREYLEKSERGKIHWSRSLCRNWNNSHGSEGLMDSISRCRGKSSSWPIGACQDRLEHESGCATENC